MSVFKVGDQVVVDDYLENANRYTLDKSHICKVLVIGKLDLLLESTETNYHPKVFAASKSCCRVINDRQQETINHVITPKINDLVVGYVTDYNGGNKEIHVGTLEEIHHRNMYSKTAVLKCGNKRVSITFEDIIVLEAHDEK